jgi:hypothetical protein
MGPSEKHHTLAEFKFCDCQLESSYSTVQYHDSLSVSVSDLHKQGAPPVDVLCYPPTLLDILPGRNCTVQNTYYFWKDLKWTCSEGGCKLT